MGEQHKKHNRREHLNDFHLNVAGEYVYDGALYACQSDDTKQRRSKRAVWGMAAILTVAVAAGGCIPAPGMQNCFTFCSPTSASFWARRASSGRLQSSERTGARCASTTTKKRGRSARANGGHGGLFSSRRRVRIDLLFVNDHAGQTFFALLYVLLKLIALLSVLVLRAEIMQAEWGELPKKDNS